MIRILPVLFIAYYFFSCTNKHEAKEWDFRPDSYWTLKILAETKLSDTGKLKAKAAWDSIRPLLKVDSTVHGYEYQGMIHASKENNLLMWLTFDYDTTYKTPSNLKFNMIPGYQHSPRTFMYFGDMMVICSNKFTDGQWSDTLGIALYRGVRQLVEGQGIRYDTDRGPTEKLDKDQVNSIKQVLIAYQALALLSNSYNKNQLPL